MAEETNNAGICEINRFTLTIQKVKKKSVQQTRYLKKLRKEKGDLSKSKVLDGAPSPVLQI